MTTLRGEHDFHELADRLNAAADKDLRKEIYSGLREIARPVGEAMAHALGGAMPQGGGLGPRVAQAGVRQTNATTGRSPRVVVWLHSKEGWDLAGMEAGTVKHPVFGHRPLVSQSVPAGRASAAADAMVVPVRMNLERHLRDSLDKIGR